MTNEKENRNRKRLKDWAENSSVLSIYLLIWTLDKVVLLTNVRQPTDMILTPNSSGHSYFNLAHKTDVQDSGTVIDGV